MRPPALTVEDLEVRHGAVNAVRGLSFEVGHGEIVGLIGPNGAGKSSTLHAIMGAVRPTGGDVRVNGASVVGRRPEDVARRGVALVPEGRRIFAELTVEENLRLVERGRLEVPAGADLAVFLVTDGKLNAKPVIDQPLTLAEVFERYEAQLPEAHGATALALRKFYGLNDETIEYFLEHVRADLGHTDSSGHLIEDYIGSGKDIARARRASAVTLWAWCEMHEAILRDLRRRHGF